MSERIAITVVMLLTAVASLWLGITLGQAGIANQCRNDGKFTLDGAFLVPNTFTCSKEPSR